MAGDERKLRLRVTFSTLIKFYVCLDSDAGLPDLKDLVARIMREQYGLDLPGFCVRSDDGYEILDYFSIGDVLCDNQGIAVEPAIFGSACPGAGSAIPAGTTKCGQLRNGVAHPGGENSWTAAKIMSFYKENEDYLRQTNETLKKKNDRLKAGKLEVLPEAKGAGSASAGGSSSSTESAAEDANTRKGQAGDSIDGAALPAKEPGYGTRAARPADKPQASKPAESDTVRFDSKFKGFAVRRKDLERPATASPRPVESFRPIKKKRPDEVIEPI